MSLYYLLDNYDLMLRAKWLVTLRDILWNFKKLRIRFTKEDVLIKLQKVEGNELSIINSTRLQKLL